MILNLESHAKLNNGVEIPRLGLGVYQSPPGKTTERAVSYALKIGYRHVDTAYLYGNESDVGKSLHESGVSREEVFITTKVWNSDQGYNTTLQACEGVKTPWIGLCRPLPYPLASTREEHRDMEGHGSSIARR